MGFLINKIKKWPSSKKRFFSIFIALFLTILIIILNSVLNNIWKENKISDNYEINKTKESVTQIINNTKGIFDNLKNIDTATTSDNMIE